MDTVLILLTPCAADSNRSLHTLSISFYVIPTCKLIKASDVIWKCYLTQLFSHDIRFKCLRLKTAHFWNFLHVELCYVFLQCLCVCVCVFSTWSQDTSGFTTQKCYQEAACSYQTSLYLTMNEITRVFKTQPGDF